MHSKLTIHIRNGSSLVQDNALMLGETFAKKWNVAGQTITLKVGSANCEVKVVPIGRTAYLGLSEALASHLGLRDGIQLHARYKHGSRTLSLGPLIGVFVSRIHSPSGESPFGSMTSFCRELTDACAKYGGHVFFFTPDDITAPADSVAGYAYSGKWTRAWFPIPDVVYNRVTSRKYENMPSVQQFMKEIKSVHGTSVFNETYLDKHEVFQVLREESGAAAYLPESHLFKNFAMLRSMCGKYGTVFLKPVTGSLGNGIIRISKDGSGCVCHATGLSGVREKRYPSLLRAFSGISGKIKVRRYQIQQGVPLIRSGDRPIDFRALVQKNGTGVWVITSIVARTAGSHAFVSNVARGGTLSRVGEAVARSNLGPAQRSVIVPNLRKAALEIAKAIEGQIKAHFAELGIDLAVDPNGRVWLLEVNSKPSKDNNSSLQDNKIRPSVRHLVLYCQHLSKYGRSAAR